MAYTPTMFLKCFESLPQEDKVAILTKLLETLVFANVLWLRRNPHAPSLYQAGIPYTVEPPGRDDWQDIPETLKRQEGDCEDLACWRIAECRLGRAPDVVVPEFAAPFITSSIIQGELTYHIRVRHENGKIEDPSKNLGMR